MHSSSDPEAAADPGSGAAASRAAADTAGVRRSAELALQETCGALIGLQTSLERVRAIPGEHTSAEAGLTAAIESVRLVVAGLRELLAPHDPPLAYGFVSRRRRS